MRVATIAIICVLTACKGSDAGLGPPAGDSIDLPSPVLSARRPSVRFYEERTSERCSMFSVDGDVKSAVTDTACPEELALGDRVRIAGMTCTKETDSTGSSSAPIMCPIALLRYERIYWKALAAASASAAPSAR